MKKILFAFTLAVLLAAGCNKAQSPTALNTNPQHAPVAPPAETKQYTDTQFNFTVTLPDGFYMNKGEEDGIYAYTKAFSTQPGQNPKLEQSDIGLNVQIAHDNGQIYSSLADVNKDFESMVKADANVKITAYKNLTVGGLPALEQFADFSKSREPDYNCELETFFQQGKNVHQITAFSDDCQALLNFKPKYDAVVASFKFTK